MVLTSLAMYASFAYALHRTDFVKLITLYGALFYLFYTLIKIEKSTQQVLTFLSIASRLVFLFAIPNLSQDFYRFIWDGRMFLEGWNPYLYLPEKLIQNNLAPIAQATELYEGMGELSANNYTNYPPVNQLLFLIAAVFSAKHILGAVITLRVLIILADIGILYYGKKLLKKLNLPDYYIYLYLLNPFIIIELTGNLHFEGVMLFFLLLSIYLITIGKWKIAALFIALSIATKLLPLILLPLLLQKLTLKKAIVFYTLTLVFTIVMFAPFFSVSFVNSYSQTIALWFTNFEFNGSIYTIIKEIGFKIKGYNIIKTVGKITPVIVIAVVLGLTFLRNNKTIPRTIAAMLLALSFYFFTASVVHPWYIATLLLLSIFTRFQFPVLWSLTIMLSYYTYSQPEFKENYLLLTIQYLPVFLLFLYEVSIKTKKKRIPL